MHLVVADAAGIGKKAEGRVALVDGDVAGTLVAAVVVGHAFVAAVDLFVFAQVETGVDLFVCVAVVTAAAGVVHVVPSLVAADVVVRVHLYSEPHAMTMNLPLEFLCVHFWTLFELWLLDGEKAVTSGRTCSVCLCSVTGGER